MNGDKILQQFHALFGIFMVFFYFGAGIYLVFFFDQSNYKSLGVIMGSTFIFLGFYRAYRAYIKIVEVFFTKDKDED